MVLQNVKKKLVKFYVMDKALSGELSCGWYISSFSGEATVIFMFVSLISGGQFPDLGKISISLTFP